MSRNLPSPWIDVTVPVRTGMVHWPSDPPVRIQRIADMAKGDGATVSALSMSAHVGTHMDAPSHFVQGGATIDAMPPEATVGPARVIEIRDQECLKPRELAQHAIRRGERLLFKTLNSARCWTTDSFIEDFVYISKEAAEWLADRRVRMVGVDYLSVAGYRKDAVETHVALLRAGVWIIEGLNLAQAKPGRYQLLCLPLRLAGAEGAPARAFLRPLPSR